MATKRGGAGGGVGAAIAVFLYMPMAASAASLSWIGGVDNSWFTAANWSPAQAPTPTDDVVIDANATVVVPSGSTATFKSLTLGDTAGAAAPALEIVGALSSSGALTINPSATLLQATVQQSTLGSVLAVSGSVITHAINVSSHTSSVILNVSGNFTLQAGASITAAGLGYAGGGGTGFGPGGGFTPNGSGTGGGGGHGGTGGNLTGAPGAGGGAAYDSVSNPTDLGSGGGAGFKGGAGGGAVVLTVGGTLRIDGAIIADGGDGLNAAPGPFWGASGGAGGTANLSAGTLAGNGLVRANGGMGSPATAPGAGGGGGRIAVLVTGVDQSSLSLQANAGTAPVATNYGGAGVISLKTPGGTNYNLTVGDLSVLPQSGTPVSGSTVTLSTVTLNNSIVLFDPGSTVNINSLVIAGTATVTAANLVFGAGGVEVKPGGILALAAASTSGGPLLVDGGGVFSQANTAQLRFTSVNVAPGGLLTHVGNLATRSAILNIQTSGDFILLAGSSITVDGMGYVGGGVILGGPGSGPGAGTVANFTGNAGGGGHGGMGYQQIDGGGGSAAYDSITAPTDLGSGGARGATSGGVGGSGGGAILLNVGGVLRIDGVVSANGANGKLRFDGGGGGGTIALTPATLQGSGVVRANGGNSGSVNSGDQGGAGGGGRIAVSVGGNDASALTLAASAGAGSSALYNGGSGVIAVQEPGAPYALTIGASTLAAGAATPVTTGASPTFGPIVIVNSTVPFTVSGNVTMGNVAISSSAVTLATNGDVSLGSVTITTGAVALSASRITAAGAVSLIGSTASFTASGNVSFGNTTVSNGAFTLATSGNVSLGDVAITTAPVAFSAGQSMGLGNLAVNASTLSFTLSGPNATESMSNVVTNSSIVSFDTGSVVNLGSLSALSGSTVTANSLVFSPGAALEVGSRSVVNAGLCSGASLTVDAGGTFRETQAQPLSLVSVNVASGGVLTHSPNGSTRQATLSLNISGDMTLQPGALIVVDGLGYAAASAPSAAGSGPGAGGSGSTSGGGGGHGGAGGSGSGGSLGGIIYDSIVAPNDLGSGGGAGSGPSGGAGGGVVILQVGGTLTSNALISANGAAGVSNHGGGGAGGTVSVTVSNLAGNGSISANGGVGAPQGGAGGGGRIALFYGSKTASWSLQAAGGNGFSNGNVGTVLDNGQLLTSVPSSPASSLVPLTQQLSASQSLSETITAQALNFAGATSTGTTPGTLSVANLQLVTVQTGSFAGDGFFNGNWTLTLVSGTSLSGTWTGTAILSQSPRQITLNGVLEGGIRGVLEGALTESTPGSGTFNRLSAVCSAIQVGDQVGTASLSLSGGGTAAAPVQYPGTPLSLSQASLTGQASGYYAGALQMAYTLLRVNSPGNPYNGEGIFLPSYSSGLGSGVGWAYAATSGPSVTFSGLLEQPLRGLLEGELVTSSPQSAFLSLESLSVGAAVSPILNVALVEPFAGNAGDTGAFAITVRNDGFAPSGSFSVIAIYPNWTDFVSASGSYTLYNVPGWAGSIFSPNPFLRWDISSLNPRSSATFYYQGKFRLPAPGGPLKHTSIGGNARLITTTWANQIFAGFPPGGSQ